MVQARTAERSAFRVPESLPNDTEESVVGTEWHQEAIGALAGMLRDVADRRGAAWGVCEQVALVGLRYPSGHPYDPRPDVMVLAQPFPGSLASIPLTDVGVPLFVAEMASDSTFKNDIGDKGLVYAAIGIPEYVVFDPVGNVLRTPLLAWRLASPESETYLPWEPDADGRWHSATLGITFEATQPFLSVRDHDGTPIEQVGEVRRRARQLEQQSRQLGQQLGAMEQERDAIARRLAAAEQAQAEEARRRADLEEQLRQLRARRDEME